jgi:hypothetical protein
MLWLLMPVVFALTWVTSTVLYVCVEKPLSIMDKVTVAQG